MFGGPFKLDVIQLEPPADDGAKVHGEAPAVEAAPPVICGANLDANLLPTPEHVDADEVEDGPEAPADRLSAAEAKAAPIQAWKDGKSTREAARLATRSSSYASKVVRRLDRTRQQTPARLALVREEASA
jgi:hypothetical protein